MKVRPVDLLGVIPAPGDRVVAQELVLSRLKTRLAGPTSESTGSMAVPLLMATPNRFARHSAAEPIGAWSVINSRRPPP